MVTCQEEGQVLIQTALSLSPPLPLPLLWHHGIAIGMGIGIDVVSVRWACFGDGIWLGGHEGMSVSIHGESKLL